MCDGKNTNQFVNQSDDEGWKNLYQILIRRSFLQYFKFFHFNFDCEIIELYTYKHKVFTQMHDLFLTFSTRIYYDSSTHIVFHLDLHL